MSGRSLAEKEAEEGRRLWLFFLALRRRRMLPAHVGVVLGVLVGCGAAAAVLLTGPALSPWRLLAGGAALVLCTLAVWIPVGYAALGRMNLKG